jgi:hypothetical protein
MINLTKSDLPQAEIVAGLSQCLFFNHGRHLLTLAAWFDGGSKHFLNRQLLRLTIGKALTKKPKKLKS